MKTLVLILFLAPLMSFAESNPSSQDDGSGDITQLMCDQLSDAQCFGKPVNSICMVDAQKGQAGFCHQRSTVYDQQLVRCWCY